MTPVRLAAVGVPGEADVWRDLGFTVDHDAIGLANGAIRLRATECSLELASPAPGVTTMDGVPVAVAADVVAGVHPNGAVELDHVVVMTDSIERTSVAFEQALGLEQRRLRETETVRQAFHRFADTPDGTRGCIVELVERPDLRSVALWGLVVIVTDIDRAVTASGGLVGPPKPAVQPGRQIATVSRTAGLPLAVALMSR